MSLEAELRGRIERSLRELEEITGSLQYVRRLADSQHASVEQLTKVAEAMESVGGRLGTVTATIGETGGVLESAVVAVKKADPDAVVKRIDAVAQVLNAVGSRVDTGATLQKSANSQLDLVRATVDTYPKQLATASKDHSNGLAKLEALLAQRADKLDAELLALGGRVKTAVIGAWLAVILAGSALSVLLLPLVNK